MEAVEINAGTWYLRALRADTRVSDVPALADLGVDDPAGYVTRAAEGWATEALFTWAVCIPTTGELVALVTITPSAEVAVQEGRARVGYDDALADALPPVRRFVEGMLGLTVAD
ncbi:hypothetical protein GII33_07570 [Gordonia pseudamarae]|uniref:Uncharacterized protein n=1 Tax=Gordonia pseudamarae TaxID=2831662 RepID=A0ABX6IGK4_9ACTN|nr:MULTISPECIES: hypothetical protein [Gordonia]MBD0023348.1 hypothetical protein [Gordonia sp. (in: high G+C Gram-positive bacteria)]QHN25842.1 hypothetical protein GII33_07570 [Gordonia pseudamarae]QHN34772.1 hypothetical protein GII31_07540 [Gordonia pseudamarae]